MTGRAAPAPRPGANPPDPAAAQPSFPPRLRPRRAQTLAAMAPLLGVFLLMPPFILVFAAPVTVFDVPLVLAYLMAVWVGLIFAAWRLSGRLRRRLALSTPGPRLAPQRSAPGRAAGASAPWNWNGADAPGPPDQGA